MQGCGRPWSRPGHLGSGSLGAPGLVRQALRTGPLASPPHSAPGKPMQFLSSQNKQSETQSRVQCGPGLPRSCWRPGGEAGTDPSHLGASPAPFQGIAAEEGGAQGCPSAQLRPQTAPAQTAGAPGVCPRRMAGRGGGAALSFEVPQLLQGKPFKAMSPVVFPEGHWSAVYSRSDLKESCF